MTVITLVPFGKENLSILQPKHQKHRMNFETDCQGCVEVVSGTVYFK